jgi:hypothetical protein
MLTDNPIYCNLKMVRKPEVEGQEKEITKLAIGKPGGIDAENDKYDTIATIICKKCGKELDLAHPEVSNMASSIVLAQSAFF